MISISASSVSNEAPNILYQRVGAGMFTFSFVFRLMTLTIFRLGTLLFPLSFGIAVMRYRLWEIDIILRRTLTYGVLTALLLVLYFVIVVLSQLAIGWLVPGASPFAVVISVGAAFTGVIVKGIFQAIGNKLIDDQSNGDQGVNIQ